MSDDSRPSKTQRKKDVHALQALGEELVSLGGDQLASLELPEALRDAVMEARRVTSFEGRRRQMQYIGKLMRSVDPAPIRAAIGARQAQSRSHVLLQQRIEGWRDRLLKDESALAALAAERPDADVHRLKALVRDALHERDTHRPPRAFRALFQELRALLAKA